MMRLLKEIMTHCPRKAIYRPNSHRQVINVRSFSQVRCCESCFSSIAKIQARLLLEHNRPQSSLYLYSQPNYKTFSSNQNKYSASSSQNFKNKTVQLYMIAGVVLVAGLSYAAVPLYRIYCQATGKGGQAVIMEKSKRIEEMQKVKERVITIHFNADTISSLQWNFKPQQNQIKVVPGETALAFYTARNPMDVPVVGIATYNVLPFEAGQYFNKIQCFCFEEQRLNPNEEVDMPVFFYLDPEFAEDPRMENVDDITLSYTFFEAKEGLQLPIPTFK